MPVSPKRRYRRWLPVLFVGVLAVLLLAFPPRWGFRLAGWIAPGAVYFVETHQPVVALTIDDGPSSHTGQIQAVLARFNARATFFLLSDNLSGAEPVVTNLVAHGHELGNHLTADEASIRLSPTEFQTKLAQADTALSAYGPVHWFRPGMGRYNARMVQAAEQLGYRVALGSVFPYDTHIRWVSFLSWFVLANVQPGDIIVLHDGPDRGMRSAAVLARILPRLQQRGYRVTTLSELFASVDDSTARSHHSTSQ